ncbi:MAG: hypothetical protein OCD02_10865 [Spirochaetaceae bacterium]
MTKKIVLIILFLMTAKIYSNSFQRGNLEFTNKNYSVAIESYLEDIKKNGNNQNTLFNLGNSYIKLDKYGEALSVLYKARLLYPRDANINLLIKEIEEDLNLENQFKRFKIISFRENWILTLILLTCLSFILFIISYLSYTKQRNFLLFRLRKAAIIIFLILLLVSITGNIIDNSGKKAAIVLVTSEILISPYVGSEQSYKAKEGIKVTIIDEFENFYSIIEADGKYGWIEKDKLGILWK